MVALTARHQVQVRSHRGDRSMVRNLSSIWEVMLTQSPGSFDMNSLGCSWMTALTAFSLKARSLIVYHASDMLDDHPC